VKPRRRMQGMPRSKGAMSIEQWTDYKAACRGNITWHQYHAKWGWNL